MNPKLFGLNPNCFWWCSGLGFQRRAIPSSPDEIGGRTDQAGQSEESGDTNRKIWAHWLFESPIRGRRGIEVA